MYFQLNFLFYKKRDKVYIGWCGPSFVGQTKQGLNFIIKLHKKYILKKETNKSVIPKHFWVMIRILYTNTAKIIFKITSTLELNFSPKSSDCLKDYIKLYFS